ncbi:MULTISPECIES: DNA adenine methylase [unclassified Providencia]|uniref:DNA adenine methylase n=1 Tax=unclassified Providencia TaxID=2633465 RepID=UPI00234AC58F|nr:MULTISPECIES: DNA adenine methylase [unclassified Providencia]
MTIIKHPVIRYHGGKFRLAPWVIGHFPAHRCYVEPFGGAASVLMRKERSYAEVYNDLDSEVVNLFTVLRDTELNEKLQLACQLTPYSRDEFKLASEPAIDPVEKARRMVVRACMGFGSASGLRGNSGFRSDSKREYALASHLWVRYPENLGAICQRLQGVIIENKPAADLIKQHDSVDTLFYLDPPYVSGTRVTGNRYYNCEMTDEQHQELLSTVKDIKGKVLISGYDSDLYNDELSEWRKATKESRISACRGTGLRIECLWMNF